MGNSANLDSERVLPPVTRRLRSALLDLIHVIREVHAGRRVVTPEILGLEQSALHRDASTSRWFADSSVFQSGGLAPSR